MSSWSGKVSIYRQAPSRAQHERSGKRGYQLFFPFFGNRIWTYRWSFYSRILGVHQAIIFLIFCSHYLSYVQNKLREAIFFIKINQLINYFLSFRPGRGPCLGVSVLSWKLKTLGLAQRGSCCCCGDWQHRTLSVINWSAQVFSAKKIFNGKTFRQYLEITARGLDKSQAHKSECLPHPS